MTTPTFHQALTAWNMAIKGEKHFPLPIEVTCETAEIFNNQCAQLGQAKIEANKAGFYCQFNRSGKGARMAAWITSGGFTLKIAYTAKKEAKHTNVAQTSKEAYHSLDLGDSCKEMAIFAIGAMMRDGYCTDRGVERRSNGAISSNLVSARRADIIKAGGIKMDDGTIYEIEMTGKTEKDLVTGRSANTWKIVKRLNEPAATPGLTSTIPQPQAKSWK